jgi:glycosyltransferase involved in cell wall biosynthesis
MSVYHKEESAFLDESLSSIVKQTLVPNEIVLIKDGPLTSELDAVIDSYVNAYPQLFNIISLEKNEGLGYALSIGMQYCSHEFIARMDSDDINVYNRFEKQVKFLSENEEVAIVGAGIFEFRNKPGDTGSVKLLPAENKALVTYARRRCPFNHSSVMFRKSYILDAGSYKPMPLFEDYYLWFRVINKGYIMANINEALLYFRIGNDVIGRRQGIGYVKKEIHFYKISHREGVINTFDFLRALIYRVPIRMLPKSVLSILYKKLLRK